MYYKEIFMSKKLNSIKSILLILALVFALSLIGCTPTDGGDSDSGISDTDTEVRPVITLLRISGPRNVSLEKGDELSLIIDHPAEVLKYVEWSVEGDSVTVDQNGKITAVAVGTCKVVATYGALSDRITVTVTESPAPHEHNFVDGKCECGGLTKGGIRHDLEDLTPAGNPDQTPDSTVLQLGERAVCGTEHALPPGAVHQPHQLHPFQDVSLTG